MRENFSKTKLCFSIVTLFLLANMVSFASGAECTSQECTGTISLTLGNTAPTIPSVDPVSAITLNGGTSKTIYIVFNASDANGYLDIDHSTANVTISKGGEITRYANDCIAQENTTQQTVFNCSIDMQFYDSAGTDWNIDATVDDDSATTAQNNSEAFTLNSLDYITQDVTAVAWGTVNVGVNDEEADNPITLTNGGNQDYTAFDITGYDADNAGNVINAENFSVDSNTAQTTGQVYMVDGVATDVTSVIPGLTTHGEVVTEEVYFYVDMPSALPAGEYTQTSSWVIKVA